MTTEELRNELIRQNIEKEIETWFPDNDLFNFNIYERISKNKVRRCIEYLIGRNEKSIYRIEDLKIKFHHPKNEFGDCVVFAFTSKKLDIRHDFVTVK